MGLHKNNNKAVGNYCVYQIIVEGEIYKIGKADPDRITKCSGDPTRIHQQVRKFRKIYSVDSVYNKLLNGFLM